MSNPAVHPLRCRSARSGVRQAQGTASRGALRAVSSPSRARRRDLKSPHAVQIIFVAALSLIAMACGTGEPAAPSERARDERPQHDSRPDDGPRIQSNGKGSAREGERRQAIQRCLSDAREQVSESLWLRASPVIAAACTEFVAHRGVGFQLALHYPDGARVSIAIGRRCRDRDDPLTPGTAMRIGSVSKLITALLAVELILDGQVAVDEPVELRLNALAGTPAGRATLRELLSHRAGLAEVWPGDVWRDQSQHPDSTWLDVVARKSAEQEQRLPRDALVGAARHDSYRNVHYAIAAAYLESSVGSFQDVLGDKLLVRRGWDAVWLDASTLEPNAAACGHLGNALVLDAAHAHSVLELGADWARAAGGMLSTADQLAAIGADLPIPVEMPSPISNEISDEVPNEMPDGPIESSVVHSQPGHDHPGVAHPDGSPSDRQRAQPSRRDAARMELLAPEGVCAPKDAACRAAVRDGIKTLIEQSAQGRLGSQPTAATQGDIYTLAWAIRATAGSNVPRGASDPGAPPVQPSDSVQIPLSYGLRGATGDSAAVLLVRPAVLSFALISNDGWPYHGTTLRAATVAATDQSPRQPPLRSPW